MFLAWQDPGVRKGWCTERWITGDLARSQTFSMETRPRVRGGGGAEHPSAQMNSYVVWESKVLQAYCGDVCTSTLAV